MEIAMEMMKAQLLERADVIAALEQRVATLESELAEARSTRPTSSGKRTLVFSDAPAQETKQSPVKETDPESEWSTDEEGEVAATAPTPRLPEYVPPPLQTAAASKPAQPKPKRKKLEFAPILAPDGVCCVGYDYVAPLDGACRHYRPENGVWVVCQHPTGKNVGGRHRSFCHRCAVKLLSAKERFERAQDAENVARLAWFAAEQVEFQEFHQNRSSKPTESEILKRLRQPPKFHK